MQKEKFIPMDKQSKKAQRAFNASKRQVNGFNTGTRVMKTSKYPTRAMSKENFFKEISKTY